MWRKGSALLVLLTAGLPVGAAPLQVSVQDDDGQPVADAVVYALGAEPLHTHGEQRVEIDQLDKRFVPRVSVLQTGTWVHFPNHDRIRHNVYSFSPAKTFDLKLYGREPQPPLQFDKAGLVVMGCSIHDGMIAYALVVDTPWFAKSDAAGQARVDELPAGDYGLHLWHPRLRAERVQSLTMPAQGKTLVLRVKLEREETLPNWR